MNKVFYLPFIALLLLLSALAGFLLVADVDPPDDPEVVARVNGEAIYKKDLVSGMGLAGGAGLPLSPEDLRGRVLRDLIDAELVYQTYHNSDGENLTKEKVLRCFLDDEIYTQVEITDDEVEAFWLKNIKDTPGEVYGKNKRSLERRIAFGKTRAVWDEKLGKLREKARIEIFPSHLP